MCEHWGMLDTWKVWVGIVCRGRQEGREGGIEVQEAQKRGVRRLHRDRSRQGGDRKMHIWGLVNAALTKHFFSGRFMRVCLIQ